MAYAIANRVFETSTSTGTGSFNLAGSTTGFQTFVAGIGDGNTCNYFISNDTDWEAGIGTITAGSPDVLSRDTVLESSNADAKVNWGSGTKNVYVPFLAQNTVVTNKDNTFTGTNTFSNPVTVATATLAGHAVTKAQLDANTPPDASDTVKGIVELATNAETITGTDTVRAVTPAGLQAKFDTINSIVSGTSQATTSGTSIDFSSIPSGVKQITLNLSGVSVNGTSNLGLQLGDSGGIETSGYTGTTQTGDTGISQISHSTTALLATTPFSSASTVFYGTITFTLLDGATNTWAYQGSLALTNYPATSIIQGTKSLSATLDTIRITTIGGANTFDAGIANITYI